jgi:hypothetical protein
MQPPCTWPWHDEALARALVHLCIHPSSPRDSRKTHRMCVLRLGESASPQLSMYGVHAILHACMCLPAYYMHAFAVTMQILLWPLHACVCVCVCVCVSALICILTDVPTHVSDLRIYFVRIKRAASMRSSSQACSGTCPPHTHACHHYELVNKSTTGLTRIPTSVRACTSPHQPLRRHHPPRTVSIRTRRFRSTRAGVSSWVRVPTACSRILSRSGVQAGKAFSKSTTHWTHVAVRWKCACI